MPRFFAPGPSSASLAHWIGWRLGAGVASIGREVDYLTQRAKTASERERSAWLFRCIVSCALVIAEYFFLYVILSRRDTLLALGSAWLVLLLLPRPTPRIPLFAGRCLAFVVTIANASVGLDWLGRALPAINAWSGILWFVRDGRPCLFGRSWRCGPVHPSAVQASMSRHEEVQGGASSQWSNVPEDWLWQMWEERPESKTRSE